ncbi:TRAP transporter small permease subunit [Vibrio sp. SA48]
MFKKIDSNLYDVLLSITAFLLLIAVLLTFYQVVTRFVFDSPTPWSEILARGVIIWAVFLGLPCVVRYGELISIDIIYKLFNAHHYFN